ncbi:MAG: LssY C-terminal domain-containing protein [Bryobacteraceae bacterium]
MIRTVLCFLLATAPLCAQTQELDLQPGSGWFDTGIDLQPEDSVHITATGKLQYANAKQPNGPEGLPRGFVDLLRVMQVNDSGRGALVGRIGSSDADRPFLIGADHQMKAVIAGHLYVAINQSSLDNASGTYHVTIERTAAPDSTKKTDVQVPEFPRNLLDSIPRRVSDPSGSPGDRVNFIVIGSEQQMQAAFKAAGWVVVDKTDKDAVLQGFISSFSKESYVTMPMSLLDLFGRPQDFGYAQADPLRVVASRHHFRIWKAPFTVGGLTVWAGAGTHDTGFDRDHRNNGITHKIDPDTDNERDFIRDNLTQTGLVVKTQYMTPTDPVLKAKTATGEEFTSDGRTLLIYLR